MGDWEVEELVKCTHSCEYFINNYCYIYDAADGGWIPFTLWPMQAQALKVIDQNKQSVILKARQIGLTWLCLARALWLMIYRDIAVVSIFSRREVDAKYLLGEDRLRGMYNHLPDWMLEGHETVTDNVLEWGISNGSVARSFPTSAGDSYTATYVMVDEADLAEDLNSLLRSVKPTIANGGKIVLLSRADKEKPMSAFKEIYQEAVKGNNGWAPIFLPWYAHPGRTQEWYEEEKKDIQSRTKALDDLYEQYPNTADEALAPRATDKRIPMDWLRDVYKAEEGDRNLGLEGLTVFRKPETGRSYVIGADPAEGNPNSDPSAAVVLDVSTGEEVAIIQSTYQPNTFTDYLEKLSRFYNDAEVLCERNNHGHAVLLKFAEDGFEGTLNGLDTRPGWLNSSKGKAVMYTHCTQIIQEQDTIIHNQETLIQLISIVGSTLKAPEHMHDDLATAYALAQCARTIVMGGEITMVAAKVADRAHVPASSSVDSDVIRPVGRSSVRSVSVVRKATRSKELDNVGTW